MGVGGLFALDGSLIQPVQFVGKEEKLWEWPRIFSLTTFSLFLSIFDTITQSLLISIWRLENLIG